MDLIIFHMLTAQVIEVSSPDTNSNNFVILIQNLTVIGIEFNSLSHFGYLRYTQQVVHQLRYIEYIM